MLELVRLTIEAAHQAHCGKKIPDMVQTRRFPTWYKQSLKETKLSVSITNQEKLTFINLINVNFG